MKAKLTSRQLYALKAEVVRVLRFIYIRKTGISRFTLAEIAAVLGCTKEKVRQLEARGRRNFQR